MGTQPEKQLTKSMLAPSLWSTEI